MTLLLTKIFQKMWKGSFNYSWDFSVAIVSLLCLGKKSDLCVTGHSRMITPLCFPSNRRHGSKESGLPLQWKNVRRRGALGHRQLHALLLPAGPDPLLHGQLPAPPLLRTHQRGGKLLSHVSR